MIYGLPRTHVLVISLNSTGRAISKFEKDKQKYVGAIGSYSADLSFVRYLHDL